MHRVDCEFCSFGYVSYITEILLLKKIMCKQH